MVRGPRLTPFLFSEIMVGVRSTSEYYEYYVVEGFDFFHHAIVCVSNFSLRSADWPGSCGQETHHRIERWYKKYLLTLRTSLFESSTQGMCACSVASHSQLPHHCAESTHQGTSVTPALVPAAKPDAEGSNHTSPMTFCFALLTSHIDQSAWNSGAWGIPLRTHPNLRHFQH